MSQGIANIEFHMPNNSTGVYQAVMQVSVRQINGLLATMHQNGAAGSGLSPNFPHSLRNLRVGDRPAILDPEIVKFANWVGGAVQNFRAAGGPAIGGAEVAAYAPPGAAVGIRAALEKTNAAWTEEAMPGVVRGRAEVQVSTPSFSLPPGSTSEVTVQAEVRARFIPDDGFSDLPSPIHGEVQITYQVRPMKLPDGKRVLNTVVPTQDSHVKYKDLGGLNQADAAVIAARVRTAVRKDFRPEAIGLPDDFQYFEFKEIGGGQAIAMPLQLSADPPPVGGLSSLTNLFLNVDLHDFALAVSREYIAAQFQPIVTRLSQFRREFRAALAPYVLSITSVDLQFKTGWLELNIQAKATTTWVLWPDFKNIVITQRLTLKLGAQGASIQALDNELTISGLPGAAMEAARTQIIAERNRTLNPSSPSERPEKALSDELNNGLNRLNNALKQFDVSGTAGYSTLDVTQDGIVARGNIETKHHYQPVVEISYTDDGNSFSALNCWIPGGRIQKFIWTHVTGNSVIPWFNKAKSQTFPHSFTYPIPAALKGQPSWSKSVCLTIEGDQVDKNGVITAVGGFKRSGSCEVSSHEPVLVVPPWWEAIYGVFWLPRDPERDLALEEYIGGHINTLAHSRPANGMTTNALVHFAGAQRAKPLEAIGRSLALMKRPNKSLTLAVVMPVGTFRSRRSEVEELLGSLGESFNLQPSRASSQERPESDETRFLGPLLITEDYAGGWSRTFDATSRPSTYLMNARGEFVWKQEGRVEVESLAAAMDEHFLPAPTPRALPLRLIVRPGDRVPDALAEAGDPLGIYRLRGKQVLLNFWQSWSYPCIGELRRLQELQQRAGERAPVILAINGGEDRSVLADVRRQHKLTLTMIHDDGQQIAQSFGVHCWPTTVSIDADGRVDQIQFGIVHDHADDDTAEAAG